MIVAAMAGVDYGKIPTREREWRGCCIWRHSSWLRPWGRSSGRGLISILRNGGSGRDGHRASVVAETRNHRNGGIHRYDCGSIAFAVIRRGDGLVAESQSR